MWSWRRPWVNCKCSLLVSEGVPVSSKLWICFLYLVALPFEAEVLFIQNISWEISMCHMVSPRRRQKWSWTQRPPPLHPISILTAGSFLTSGPSLEACSHHPVPCMPLYHILLLCRFYPHLEFHLFFISRPSLNISPFHHYVPPSSPIPSRSTCTIGRTRCRLKMWGPLFKT